MLPGRLNSGANCGRSGPSQRISIQMDESSSSAVTVGVSLKIVGNPLSDSNEICQRTNGVDFQVAATNLQCYALSRLQLELGQ